MFETVVRVTAIALSLVLVVSYGLFVADRFGGASRAQQEELAAGQPTSPGALPQPRRHEQPRRFIDGAAHALLSPFAGLMSSKEPWVNRSVPTAIGLLIYGLGLGFAARFARGRA